MAPAPGRPAVPALRAPLVVYAVVQAGLIVATSLLPGRPGPGVQLVIIGLAVLALGYGVIRYRPTPTAGWLWILGAIVALAGSGLALAVPAGLRPDDLVGSEYVVALATGGQLMLVVGFTLLSRGLTRRLAADLLDAVMTTLAAYLLLWIVVIEPAVVSDVLPVYPAVLAPVSTLLVLMTAIRLVLGTGVRDPAIALLLLATLALTLAFWLPILFALKYGALPLHLALAPMSAIAFALFGAIGLHPALRRHRVRPVDEVDETAPQRIALFVVLSLVPPVASGFEVFQGHWAFNRPLLLAVPAAVSAAFLIIIVVRLVLAILAAQRRANELSRRTAALTLSLSEQEALQEQLAYRASHDPLTGLANRSVLTETIEAALDDPRAAGRHALLLLDLDHFKDINDTLGHPVGDRLLVEVANRVRELTPPDATLVRLGGDEFAAFLEQVDTDTALELAERLRAELRRPYTIGGRELFVTTSVGVLVTGAHRTPSEALRDADLALYDAKSAGKDRVSLFHPGLRLARLDHARISAGLRSALARDEFVVHYQPILEVDSGSVVAVEALLRWRTEQGRLLPPDAFIPVAEDTGQVEQIGAWTLQRALFDVKRWFEEHQVAVSVNVSARQLAEPGFASTVLGCLHEYSLPGEALIIEITESSLVGTAQTATRAHLDRLREHGIRIAIDDFGTGYSSLSYVARLPVDIVKVDKSFVQGLSMAGTDGQDWAFTRAILQLVASLDKLAVAEGVETAEQAIAVRTLRCPLVQGFHYSRPVPADVIDRALARSTTFAAPAPST